MGGTLIVEILEAAPEIKRKGIHLVLQPMTHSEDVRLWLAENSFEITEEKCVFDTGKIYCCMSADFAGSKTEHKTGYYYFGTLNDDSEENSAFISSQYKRIKTKLDALTAADKDPDDIEKLTRIVSYYKERYTK
jgi:tRNA A22 N-methylase